MKNILVNQITFVHTMSTERHHRRFQAHLRYQQHICAYLIVVHIGEYDEHVGIVNA
jgi:hypothetical protein